jgi:hypothetical protein
MDKELKVVISAEDNATQKLLRIKEVLGEVGDKTEKVSEKTDRLTIAKNDLGAMMTKSTAIGFALVEGLVRLGEALSDVVSKTIDSATAFQQQRIAFNTLLKDEKKAEKMMLDLSEFAERTPFNLENLNEASVRLLAYGVAHEEVLPLMSRFGDIASLVGTEKLPNLIRAYGQARNTGKVMLEEVNQLTDAGVPILEALTAQLNKHGGVTQMVGGSTKEVTKEAEKLNKKLDDQTFKLKFMEKEGDKNTKQYKNLKEQIKFTKEQIKDLGPVTEGSLQKVPVKIEDMRKLIEKGVVSFDDLTGAIEIMTNEGGLYFGGMGKQGKSFGAIMEQTNEKFMKFARQAMGMSEAGDIREGSLLAIMQESALKLTAFLDANGQEILDFLNLLGQKLLDVANSELFKAFISELTKGLKVLWDNKEAILSVFEGIITALGLILTFKGTIAILAGVGSAIAFLITPIGAVIAGIIALYVAWDSNLFGIKDLTFKFFGWVYDNLPRFIQWAKDVWDMFARFLGWVWENLTKYLSNVWDNFTKTFQTMLNLFTAVLKGDWEGAFNYLKLFMFQWVSYINALFGGLPKMVAEELLKITKGIVDFAKNSLDAISKWAGEIRDKIKSAFDWNKKESPSYNDLATETEKEAKKKFEAITKGFSVNTGASSASSGNTNNVNINFTGAISVRNEQDINLIAMEVKRIINREDVLFSQGIV